jgi:uncharacterized membrane protein YeaQ/YmgE (transglycosylase-associated protein family)
MKEIVNFVAEQYFAHKELLITLGIGGACGVIAQMIMPGKGLGIVPTIILGVIGCYAGTYFLLEYITFVDNHILKNFIAGIAGSMVLLGILNVLRLAEPKHKDKTKWRNNA